jgi:cytochrome b561
MKYPASIRILHWLMAVIVLFMIALGWRIADLPDTEPTLPQWLMWHMSFGQVVLTLALLRAGLRWQAGSAIPPLPEQLTPLEKTAAFYSHRLMYVLLILIPIAGLTMVGTDLKEHKAVHFFGFDWTPLLPQSEVVSAIAQGVHEGAAYTLLAVIGLHVAGALKHRFVDRGKNVDVLSRML